MGGPNSGVAFGARGAFLQAVDADGFEPLAIIEARIVCVEVVIVSP